MASTFTTNKNIEKPAHNDYVDTWEVPVNSNSGIIDASLGSVTSINVTGLASYTFSYADLQARTLKFTGVLNSGVIPFKLTNGISGDFIVINATTQTDGTSALQLTWTGAVGAAYTVPQGATQHCYADSTPTSGGTTNPKWFSAAPTAALQSGLYGVDSGGTNTLVVTVAASTPSLASIAGIPILVLVGHTNTTTTPSLNVNGLGATTIGGWNGFTVAVGALIANTVIQVAYNSVGNYFEYMGPAAVATVAQIQAGADNSSPLTSLGSAGANPSSLTTTNGYKKFADGTIIQWGQFTTVTGTGEDVTLPIAFPTAQVACIANSVVGTDLVLVCAKPTVATPLTKIHLNAGSLNTSPPTPAVGVLIRFVSIGF